MRRRVLFITRSMQAEPGGMQTATRLLIDALRARPDMDIKVLGWGGSKLWLPLFFLRALFTALAFPGDAVHFGDALFAPLFGGIKLCRPLMHLSCTAHGLDVVYPVGPYQIMLRGNLAFCDRVAAVSTATASAVRERCVEPSRIVTVPWGVPHAPLAGEPTAPILLSVGRQIRRKGTTWFIGEVLPILWKKYPALTYTVVRSGKESGTLRALVRKLKARGRVTLTGAVPDAEKEAWYARAALFVMPNIPISGDMEGFGMACIEAAARGIPTVAADLEGISDAVREGETGTLFASGDAEAAALAVERALVRPWDRAGVQASCRAHYDIATVASRYATEVFVSVDDRHPHG